MTTADAERRMTMYAALGIWVHVTRDDLWIAFIGLILMAVATFAFTEQRLKQIS